jgi:hypothetical protein
MVRHDLGATEAFRLSRYRGEIVIVTIGSVLSDMKAAEDGPDKAAFLAVHRQGTEAMAAPPLDLTDLARAAKEAGPKGLPPVHLWNPPFCGDIDMRIAADGTWYYMKTPIGRPALVRLFSTILRRDGDKYVLVTPVERVGITVDDAPFVAVEMQERTEGDTRVLRFRTNVDDWVEVGAEHEMIFRTGASEGFVPYIHVRAELWARVARSLFYDLVAVGEVRSIDGIEMFGVSSGGQFFAMAPAAEIGWAG